MLHLLPLVMAFQAAASPQGGAVALPGDVFTANLRGSSVSWLAEDGALRGLYVDSASGGLRGATGIAFGPDGDLYVGSSGTHRVLRFDGARGTFVGPFVADSTLQRPFSLVFGPDGDLYVSSMARVLRYDGRTGAYRSVAAEDASMVQPIGIAFATDGSLLVANSTGASILRFDPASGSLLGIFAADSASLAFVSDVAVASGGDVFASSAGTRSVVRFASDGRVRATFVLPDGGVPVGLAVCADGRLLVSDFGHGRVWVLAPGADALTLFGDLGDPALGPENLVVKPVPATERPGNLS